eukprot:2967986-Lingulodinium_polyedra.AAC.1
MPTVSEAKLAKADDVSMSSLLERGDLSEGLKREVEHQKRRRIERRVAAITIGQMDISEVPAQELE